MKKLLSLILALTLVFAMAVPALADDVTITTSVAESYQITIPAATTNLEWGKTDPQTFGNVGLSKVRLEPDHQVTIRLSGNDGLVKAGASTIKIAYAIMNGEDEFASANFTNTTPIPLTIVVAQEAWDAAPAGEYSDIVTFTAEITDIVAPPD